MSNEFYDFNLGHSTAYAYAKASGDLPEGMTPEEYGELLAAYATVGQTAVTAAQTATTKASEAATSATTATNKASEATTAAQTATTKAGEASTSASTATSAKDTAVSASQTATTKATEATTAAATAVSAKDDAVSANTAAQSAKTAAQTAQTGAETAAASVSASAAQIATNTEDIAQLKSDLSDFYQIEKLTIESTGPVSIPIAVSIGDTYRVKNNTSATLSFRYVTADNTILQEKDVAANNEADVTSTVNADHIRIYFNGTGTASVESLDKYIPKIISEIDGIKEEIMNLDYVETSIPDNLYNPIENKKNYVILNDGSEALNTGYFHTGYIPLENNTAISFTNQKLAQDLNGFTSMAVFDKNKTFLERYNMPNDVSFIEFRQDAKFAIFNAQNEYSWGKELVINYGKALNAYTEYHAFRVNDKKFNSSMDTMIPQTEYPSFKIEPKIPNPQIDQQSDNISYSELIGLYDALVTDHTTYITKSVLGHDESNTYDIPVYVFKTENMVGVENNKPNIFIWAGLHGAEKPAITAMYNFAYNLANNLDDELFSLLHYYANIHIIPCMNPWGYVNNTRTNSNHVDINRNFAYKWESGDDDPTSDRYHGASALSEAETQIIINYAEDVNPIVILDFHTWGVNSSIEQLYGENARYCFETPSKESCYQGKQNFNDSSRTYDVMINAAYDAIVNQSRIARQEYNIPLGEKYIGIVSSSVNSGTIVNYFGSQGKACCSPEAAYHLTKNQLHDEYLGKANVNWIAEAIRVSLNEFINFPFIQ